MILEYYRKVWETSYNWGLFSIFLSVESSYMKRPGSFFNWEKASVALRHDYLFHSNASIAAGNKSSILLHFC